MTIEEMRKLVISRCNGVGDLLITVADKLREQDADTKALSEEILRLTTNNARLRLALQAADNIATLASDYDYPDDKVIDAVDEYCTARSRLIEGTESAKCYRKGK